MLSLPSARGALAGIGLAASFPLAFPVIAVEAEAAPTLMPHRAVYELTLDRRGGGTGVTGLTGRLVIEMMGSECSGYAVNFRLVTSFADSEGQTTTSDLRSTTFEGGEGESFRFLTQNYVNENLTEETDGEAVREGDEATAVTLSKPDDKSFALERGVLFPTEHLKAIISAAEGGERLLQAKIYDGSETGEKTYETTAVIGREGGTGRERQTPDEGGEALSDATHWPVTISYFEETSAAGEEVPVYEISFDLYDNGVSSDLHLDYGDFAIRGRLASLDAMPTEQCD